MKKRGRIPKTSPIRTPEGEGVGETAQTKIKLLRPEDVWQPALGAPRGNRNAGKPLSTLEARVRDLRRRMRAAIRQIDGKC